jgi:hypothetical protein
MRGSEAVGDLRRDLNKFADGDGFAVKQRPKRLAFDQFTDDVLLTALNSEVIDRDDVGVIERSNGACLTFKAPA